MSYFFARGQRNKRKERELIVQKKKKKLTFSSNHQLAMNADPDALEQFSQWQSAVVDGLSKTSYWIFLQRHDPNRRILLTGTSCAAISLTVFKKMASALSEVNEFYYGDNESFRLSRLSLD